MVTKKTSTTEAALTRVGSLLRQYAAAGQQAPSEKQLERWEAELRAAVQHIPDAVSGDRLAKDQDLRDLAFFLAAEMDPNANLADPKHRGKISELINQFYQKKQNTAQNVGARPRY